MHVIEVLVAIFCLISSTKHKDSILFQADRCPYPKSKWIFIITTKTVPYLCIDRVDWDGMGVDTRKGVEALVMKQIIFLQGN